MPKISYTTLFFGAIVVVSLAQTPNGTDSTSLDIIDTIGHSVYRYDDAAQKYKTPALPDTQTREIELSRGKISIIQKELKSASRIAKTGLVLYCIGLTADISGTIVLLVDAKKHHYSSSTPMRGYYISLGGGVTEIIGTIDANSGGSKARNVLEVTYGNAPSFKGWGYFWAGFACSVTGSVFSMIDTDVPFVFPLVFSIGGFAFNLSSIIHSVNYSKKAYLRSVVLKDLKVSPMVDMRSFKPNGLMISGEF